MPDDTAGTREIMRWLATEISPDTFVNVMDQYRPEHKASQYPGIDRRLTRAEFRRAAAAAREEGLWRIDRRDPHPRLRARLLR